MLQLGKLKVLSFVIFFQRMSPRNIFVLSLRCYFGVTLFHLLSLLPLSAMQRNVFGSYKVNKLKQHRLKKRKWRLIFGLLTFQRASVSCIATSQKCFSLPPSLPPPTINASFLAQTLSSDVFRPTFFCLAVFCLVCVHWLLSPGPSCFSLCVSQSRPSVQHIKRGSTPEHRPAGPFPSSTKATDLNPGCFGTSCFTPDWDLATNAAFAQTHKTLLLSRTDAHMCADRNERMATQS